MSEQTTYEDGGMTTFIPQEEDGSQNVIVTGVQACQVLIGLLGVLGNLACVFVLRRKSVRNNTNLLIVNQSIIDCIASGLLAASILSDIGGIRSLKKSPLAAAIYCNLWNSLLLVFGGFAISTFNLVALSIERYIAVVHPVWYLQHFKKHAVYILVAGTWILGPIFQLLIVLLHYEVTPEGQCLYVPRYTSILVIVFFWDYFIPACIMTFSFVEILRKFRKLNKVSTARGTGELRRKRVMPIPSTSAYPAPTQNQTADGKMSVEEVQATGTNGDVSGSDVEKKPSTSTSDSGNKSSAPASEIKPSSSSSDEDKKVPNVQLQVPTLVRTKPPGDGSQQAGEDQPTSQDNGKQVPGRENGTNDNRSTKDTAAGKLQRRNTTKVLLAMYIIYLVCWSPNQWTFLQFNLGGSVDFNSAWYRFLVIMGNLNTCVNPFLFALRLKVYRNEIRAMVRNFIRRFTGE